MPDAPSHQAARVSSLLLTAAAFVVVVAGLKAAQSLVNPFLLAVFVAVISAPPLLWLEARGLARGAALVIVIGAVVAALAGLSAVAGASIDDFSRNLPYYGERLEARLAFAGEALRGLAPGLGPALPAPAPEGAGAGAAEGGAAAGLRLNPAWVLEFAGELFNGLGAVLTDAFLILLAVVFILLEASSFSGKLSAIAGGASRARAGFDAFAATLRRYLAIKSLMSLGTGTAVGAWLWLLGVDYPVLWGLLAFLLNYVPTIGSVIAAVPAVLLAFVQLGPGAALWSAAGYLFVNVLFGNVVEPRFMGRGLGLSPLVVFLSLVFWGWVLGPVGMFLSVPLTITAKIALATGGDTRWLAVLLGAGGEAQPPPDGDGGGGSGGEPTSGARPR